MFVKPVLQLLHPRMPVTHEFLPGTHELDSIRQLELPAYTRTVRLLGFDARIRESTRGLRRLAAAALGVWLDDGQWPFRHFKER